MMAKIRMHLLKGTMVSKINAKVREKSHGWKIY